MLFCDLPDEVRMAHRDTIERAGGQVEGYYDDCVQVAMPRGVWAFLADCRAAGLELIEGSMHYFPLGTDRAPEQLRHDGRYPRSRGFWMFARLRPTA